MPDIDGFVIVHGNGKLRKPRGKATSFFTRMAEAQRQAKAQGDTVVPATVHMERGPVFIREKLL